MKNNDNEKEKEIEKDLIIPFTPIKFDFIDLDNNIFDWIEKNLYKECDICHRINKNSYICLTCGDKVCNLNDSRIDILQHSNMCGKNDCPLIYMKNMEMLLCKYKRYIKRIYPLYVNESGIGPNEREIGKEFNLSHEKLELALKNYVCYDLQFN